MQPIHLDKEAEAILAEHRVSPEIYFEWIGKKCRKETQRWALGIGTLITLILNSEIFFYFSENPEKNVWPINGVVFLVFGIGLGGLITWIAWRKFRPGAALQNPLIEQMLLIKVISCGKEKYLRRLNQTQWQEIQMFNPAPPSTGKAHPTNEGTFLNEADRIKYEKLHLYRKLSGWTSLLLLLALFVVGKSLNTKVLSLFFVFLGLFFIIIGYQVFLVRRVKFGVMGGGTLTGKWARVEGLFTMTYGALVFVLGIFGFWMM